MPDPVRIITITPDELREIVRQAVAEAQAVNQPSELLTPDELAERLRVPTSWVYEQSRMGNIPTHRVGRYIRFSLAEVLDSQKTSE